MAKAEALPQDLHSQTEVQNKAAADYAAGRQWWPFNYAETGIGNYRQHTSSSTAIFGGAGDYDTFLPIRVGGGLVWGFGSGWSVRRTVEYNWEGSNIDAPACSSTEMWVTVRKSF